MYCRPTTRYGRGRPLGWPSLRECRTAVVQCGVDLQARSLDCSRRPGVVLAARTTNIAARKAYPSIVPIVLGDLNPQVDRSILQIFVFPEQRTMDARIGVPALVLTAWECVHVQDGVDILRSTGFNDAIDESEPFLLDDAGVEIVHEVPVIDRYPDAIQSE